MSGTNLGSCQTLVAGTDMLGKHTGAPQSSEMNLDDLIKAAYLISLFKSNHVSSHTIDYRRTLIWVPISYWKLRPKKKNFDSWEPNWTTVTTQIPLSLKCLWWKAQPWGYMIDYSHNHVYIYSISITYPGLSQELRSLHTALATTQQEWTPVTIPRGLWNELWVLYLLQRSPRNLTLGMMMPKIPIGPHQSSLRTPSVRRPLQVKLMRSCLQERVVICHPHLHLRALKWRMPCTGSFLACVW